jgi:hypothetical protein
MRQLFHVLLLTGTLALLQSVATAQAQSTAPHFGALFGAGISGSPLSGIAERNGMLAVPGMEYEARIVFGSPQHEWSLGGIRDQYQLDQTFTISSRSRFDYRSASLILGYSTLAPTRGVPTTFGMDLGLSQFQVSSSTLNYYTAEPEDTDTRGHAVLLNVSYGVEIPLQTVSLVPRLRLSTSYPDFGGGDGYSALHRAHHLGFKASFGVSVKAVTALAVGERSLR